MNQMHALDMSGRFDAVRDAVLHQGFAAFERASLPPAVAPQSKLLEITRVIENEFHSPSLDQPTVGALVEFWAERVDKYRSVMRAYSSLLKQNLNTGSFDFRRFRWDSAFAFGGAPAETAIRSACADLEAASHLVKTFGEIQDEQDALLAGRYNFARWLAWGVANSVLSAVSSGRDITGDRRGFIPVVARVAAERALKTALEAAQPRGITLEFTEDILKEGWDSPCAAMFEYIAERWPTILIERYINDTSCNVGLRTLAVESLSEALDQRLARETLIRLAKTAPMSMREAAIMGLQAHLDADCVQLLRGIADDQSESPVVREAAEDVLNERSAS
jgi:hypothetical protein